MGQPTLSEVKWPTAQIDPDQINGVYYNRRMNQITSLDQTKFEICVAKQL